MRYAHMGTRADPYVEWIRLGLTKPGKTQSGLAAKLGIDQSSVSKMLSGKRLLHTHEIELAAEYLDEAAPVPMVEIAGIVGANPDGTIVHAEGQGTGDFAPLPLGVSDRAVALEVRGHSMRGLADDGALIYYEDRRDPPDPDSMLGHMVVVGLDTGEVLVKRLMRGSEDGLYDLESAVGVVRRDARVEWAAHIANIVPPYYARRVIRRGHL